MHLSDAAPSMGTQLMDGGPDSVADRAAAASSHFPDSDQHVRGLAATADSTSYDTEMDLHATFAHAIKPWSPAVQPLKPATLRPFPLCPGLRGFPVDGESAPTEPQESSACGDFIRYMGLRTREAARKLREVAFTPPAGSAGGGNVGALWSLVTRQVHVGLQAWESYQEELLDRKGEVKGSPRPSILGPPLLHPLCGAAMGWSTAMLLFDLIFTAFWVPVNVAFCLEQYGKLDAVCTRTDMAGGIVYLVNILLGFQTGVTLASGYRSRVVVDGRDAARLYASTLAFWLDVLAVAPFVYLLVVLGLGDEVDRHQTVSIISLIRLVRLFRVASIIKQLYSSSSGGEMQSSWVADHFTVTPIYMALLLYLAMVLVNLYSCLLLLIAHYEQQHGKNSWMSSISWMDVAGSEAVLRWYNAVYFCITVMTTTGYADFVPKSAAEQALVSVIMLNGLVIFGTVVALIGSALKRSQETAQVAHDKRKRLTRLRHWLQEGKVPERVCRDVITFFAELSVRRDGGRTESDIVFELPSHLRQQVAQHVVLGLLSQCAPLAGLPLEVRELLASHCVPIELPTGHDLFRVGDFVEGRRGGLWLLEDGVVGAYRNQEYSEMPGGPTGLGVPCLLGEGAILADIIPACSGRIWTLRTERPCRIWHLRESALRACLQIYPAIAPHVMLFVRDRIMAWLSGQDEQREDEGWCEVVQLLKRSFIMGPLRERSQDCYLALQLASLQDGTLSQLLAAWLEMSVPRKMILTDQLDDSEAKAAAIGAAPTWTNRASAANHENLVTPAATPEDQPATPEASIAGGRIGRGGDTAASWHCTSSTSPVVLGRSGAGRWVSGNGVPSGGTCGSTFPQLGLPMPPAPALAAGALLEPPRPPPPRHSRQFRSDSGRLIASTLPTAVEKALIRMETLRRSGGSSGGIPGEGSGRRGAQSESDASDRKGLKRALSNPLVGSRAASDAEVAVPPPPPPRHGAGPPPPPGAMADRLVHSTANAVALQERSSYSAKVSSLVTSPFSADRAAAAAAAAAGTGGMVAGGRSGNSDRCTPPLGSDSSLRHTLAAAAPARVCSNRLPGSAGSGAYPRVAGDAAHLEDNLSPGSPQWISVPDAVHAELPSTRVRSSFEGCHTSPPPTSTGTSVSALHGVISAPRWRRASSFEADIRGEVDNRVVVQPMSPPEPTSPTPNLLWYGIAPGSAAAAAAALAAAAARVRQTPMSPELPGEQSQSTAAPAHPQVGPPSPAVEALVRQASAGHKTFMHKIFLAAGVNLHPRPTEVAEVGTAAAAGTTGIVSPFQHVGPTIIAPACTTCGCATCAHCARPIIPQGAVSVMRPLEQAVRGQPAAAITAAAGGAAGSGAPHSPTLGGLGNPHLLRTPSCSKAGLLGSQGSPSRQSSALTVAAVAAVISRQPSSANVGGGIISRQVSGANHSMSGGGEHNVLPSGSSVTRPPLALSASAPRNSMGRFRTDRVPQGASSLTRGVPLPHQRVPSALAAAQAPALTRLRSSSGVNNTIADFSGRLGSYGGVSRSGAGADSLRSVGSGAGGFSGGGGSAASAGGGIIAPGVAFGSAGNSGRASGSMLTPGAALALAAASVSGHADKPVGGRDSGGGDKPLDELRPSEAGLADALLPRSGTMRII